MNTLVLLCATMTPSQCYTPPPPPSCYYPSQVYYYPPATRSYQQPARTTPQRTAPVPSINESSYRPYDEDDAPVSRTLGRSTFRSETYKEPIQPSYTPPRSTGSSDEKLDAILRRLDEIERRLKALEKREKDL
jgi:hypothetical protein